MTNNFEQIVATVTGNLFDNRFSGLIGFKLSLADFISLAVIFLIAYGIQVLMKLLFAWQARQDKIRKSQSKTLGQLSGYIIFICAVTAAFSSVGYSLTYLFVGSTALLVGLGFGLQQLFVDLISGIILLVDKNINYGDVVKVEIAGSQIMQGKIINIGLRATLIETIDNEMIIIPNSKMLQTGIKSLMRNKGSVRFRINVAVAYNSDMEKVRKVILKIVDENLKIDKNPESTVIIKAFQDSAVLVEVRFWMKELFNSETILSDIRFKILDEFQHNEIKIPFPHIVLHQGNDIK